MNAGPSHRPLLALLIRLGAIAALATMSALIKLAAGRGIHLLEIMFWRQFLTIPIVLAWVLATSGITSLATHRPGTHFLRGLYGTIGMVLNFGAVILLPLAEATTINFTVPIWAVLLSIVLLKERVGIWRWSAVILGFAGILVIAQPGGGHFPLYGALVALGGAFMIALISIQIADLNRTERPLTIVFYFALFSAPLAALSLPFVATRARPARLAAVARHRPGRRAGTTAADGRAALRHRRERDRDGLLGPVLGHPLRLAAVRNPAPAEHLAGRAADRNRRRDHRLARAQASSGGTAVKSSRRRELKEKPAVF
jgi:drug/metabolite transporter (DMT)-like permease